MQQEALGSPGRHIPERNGSNGHWEAPVGHQTPRSQGSSNQAGQVHGTHACTEEVACWGERRATGAEGTRGCS